MRYALLSGMPHPVRRFRRTVTVGSAGAAIFISYRRTRRQVRGLADDQRALVWSRRHRESAERVVRTARRLRGLYVKSAQFLGARADLLPIEYIEELSKLHDRVPPHPYRAIYPSLRQALGGDPHRVFSAFELRPVAAASLAQVHRAVLRDGRRVAVKVQYPEVGELVAVDLCNLRVMLRLVHRLESSLDLEPVADAVGRLVPQELDFVVEGRNLEEVQRGLAHRADVVIPNVCWDYSNEKVLVTEYVDGVRVTDLERVRSFGIDPGDLSTRVVDIWGEQAVGLGCFHGDPHPGNILVLPDGRIGLVDFGLTARFSPEAREGLASLCRAAAALDLSGLVAAFRRLGFEATDGSPESYTVLAGRIMGTRRPADLEAVNVRVAQALRGFDISQVAPEALLIMRVLGLLSGLSAALGRPGPVLRQWVKYT